MDRNEKVEFTMEGYQKVLDALCNSKAPEESNEMKAAQLAEVAINFLL